MASATTDPAAPKFPEFKHTYAYATPAFRRLRWTLNSTLLDSISVMESNCTDAAAPREPYWKPMERPGDISWHPVSKEPLLEPKVSSITVRVAILEDWEQNWVQAHGHHCPLAFTEYSDDPSCEIDPLLVRYGPLPDPGDGWETAVQVDQDEDEDEEYTEEATWQLLMCCGEERPRRTEGKWQLRVEAKGDDGFVTVHDYVTQVHPWLMSLLGPLVLAEHAYLGTRGKQKLLVAGAGLFVNTVSVGEQIDIVVEKEWADIVRLSGPSSTG